MLPAPSIDMQAQLDARIKELMERVEEIEDLSNASLVGQNALHASLIKSEVHPAAASENGWPTRRIGEIITKARNGRSIAQDTAGRADGFVLTLTTVRDISLLTGFKMPIELSLILCGTSVRESK